MPLLYTTFLPYRVTLDCSRPTSSRLFVCSTAETPQSILYTEQLKHTTMSRRESPSRRTLCQSMQSDECDETIRTKVTEKVLHPAIMSPASVSSPTRDQQLILFSTFRLLQASIHRVLPSFVEVSRSCSHLGGGVRSPHTHAACIRYV